MQNIADLKDPNDSEGRTYREVNNATSHSFELGLLVEIDDGVRMYIVNQSRDCDGTPLYSLSPFKINPPSFTAHWLNGISEYDMKLIYP